MDGKDIAKLAASLAAGSITEEYIRRNYGSGVLTTVLGLAGGIGAGFAVDKLLDVLDEQTGVVSEVGGAIDSAIDSVWSIFD